jgi:hypothetical protein
MQVYNFRGVSERGAEVDNPNPDVYSTKKSADFYRYWVAGFRAGIFAKPVRAR